MKKYYSVLVSFCAITAAFAQAPAGSQNIPSGPAMKPTPDVTVDVAGSGNQANAGKHKFVMRRGSLNYSNQIRIGSTYYDLQSNYAMPHRVLVHPNGQVSVVWTSSPNDATNFPQRGTGYNFRNLSGVFGQSDSTRIENVRTGWPNIGMLSNGDVFVIGHEATNGGFYMSKSTSLGARPSGATAILQEAPYKPIWARTANNGDTIHIIYSYTDSALVGEKRAPQRKGIFAPMVYSRSLDGGKNWDIQHIMLPKYDSTLTNNGGADQYSIDVKGNTVAIVNADILQGVVAWKSTDFGTTFTRIMVDSFAYAPYSAKKLMLDTPFTNDGTVDVLLDNNGKMHVFWGLGRVLDTDTTDQSYSFFPGIQGIAYWNEDTKTSKIIASGAAFDRTEDGANQLELATSQALSSTGGIPSGVGTVARLSNTSAMRQPNAAIDANGNLYCVFSVPLEQDISDLGANFRDLGIVYSKDGGATWGDEQNITQVIGLEDDFPSTSRNANGFVHVMWQQDNIPGTNLQSNSSSDGNHPAVLNEIRYQAIPVSEILNDNIGMVWGAGIDAPNTGEVLVVNQNYPNPFSGTTNVMIYLTRPGDVKVSVHNMAGTEVINQTSTGLIRGNHIIEINAAGLPAGVYTYSLTAGGSTVSKTMIVK